MLHPLENWISRHRDPVNFWLHMLGIPATIVAIPLGIAGHWLLAGSLFAAGYALQFLGHAIEGNRSGEAMLLDRLLGKKQAAPPKTPRRRRRPR